MHKFVDNKDENLSRLVHEQKTAEGHRINGDFVKSIVYGGLDGILSMFAIISGAAGGSLPPEAVVVLGISNLIANGISMGVGDTISTFSYHDHVANERKRECWEFDNCPEGEIEEMIDLYEEKGLPRHKAKVVVETMAKYHDFFIDIMVAEELGLRIPHIDENPYKEGLVTFLSFFFFGGLPLLFFTIISNLFHFSSNELFIFSFISTGFVLFLLGVCKSKFSSTSWQYSGIEFVLLGSTCAIVSYFIGYFVAKLGEDYFNELK